MARIRSIKPELWHDQDLTRLPRDVRLLYIALWNQCDEQARMPGDPRLVKSWCFPLDDDVTSAVVDSWLDALAAAGKVVRYTVDGSDYLHLPKLSSHQKLDPRLPSRLPAPPDTDTPDGPDPGGSHPTNTNATPVHTDESGRTRVANTDAPQPVGATRARALQVAGSRWQVAGGRGPARGRARDAAPPTPTPTATIRAQADQVLAEYLATAKRLGKPKPGPKLRDGIHRDALRLLADGTPIPPLLEAARNCAALGWRDLQLQVQRDATKRAPPSSDLVLHDTTRADPPANWPEEAL